MQINQLVLQLTIQLIQLQIKNFINMKFQVI